MILLVGATGELGLRIAKRLVSEDERVRALVRESADPARVKELEGLGVELAYGDLRDRASLDAACRGVEVVVSTATCIARDEGTLEEVDLRGQLDLVAAAEDAGVQRCVYVSFTLPEQLDLDFPLRTAKRAVEARLRDGGLEYTILQPGPFLEVWLSPLTGFDYLSGSASFVKGGGRIGFVSVDDVARTAARAVRHPGARNRTLPVSGPEAVSLGEAVTIFEGALGRPFDVEQLEPEGLRAAYAGVTDPKAASFIAMRLGMGLEWPSDNAASTALGLADGEWTGVTEHARRVASSQGATA